MTIQGFDFDAVASNTVKSQKRRNVASIVLQASRAQFFYLFKFYCCICLSLYLAGLLGVRHVCLSAPAACLPAASLLQADGLPAPLPLPTPSRALQQQQQCLGYNSSVADPHHAAESES